MTDSSGRKPRALTALLWLASYGSAASVGDLQDLGTNLEQTRWCDNAGGRCLYNELELRAGAGPQVLCVQNGPLAPQLLLTGGLLRLFDVQTVRVRGTRLAGKVERHTTSEDTWLTGVVSKQTAEAQAHSAFAPAPSSLTQRLNKLRHAVSAAWEGDAAELTADFSPFYVSCIGLRAVGDSTNVTVEWFREGPLSAARSTSWLSSPDSATLKLWSGPLLLLAGLLLFCYASTLAESVSACHLHLLSCESMSARTR
jgi:hypothetical protein